MIVDKNEDGVTIVLDELERQAISEQLYSLIGHFSKQFHDDISQTEELWASISKDATEVHHFIKTPKTEDSTSHFCGFALSAQPMPESLPFDTNDIIEVETGPYWPGEEGVRCLARVTGPDACIVFFGKGDNEISFTAFGNIKKTKEEALGRWDVVFVGRYGWTVEVKNPTQLKDMRVWLPRGEAI